MVAAAATAVRLRIVLDTDTTVVHLKGRSLATVVVGVHIVDAVHETIVPTVHLLQQLT